MATDLNLPTLEPILVADVEVLDGYISESRADLAFLALDLRLAIDRAGIAELRGEAGVDREPELASLQPLDAEPAIILDPGHIPAGKEAERTSLIRRLYLDTLLPLLLVLVVLVILLALIG